MPLVELVICAMAPFPWNETINWPYLDDNYERHWVPVPLDVIFGSLIVLRAYLMARFVVLHSRLYTRKNDKIFFICKSVHKEINVAKRRITNRIPDIFDDKRQASFRIRNYILFVVCSQFEIVDVDSVYHF